MIKSIPNLSESDFNRVLKMVPTTCIEVIIKDDDKGILLGRRNTEPFKGMWHLTGGFLHYNEKIANAVNRIAKRETGAEVEIIKLLEIIEYINQDPRGHIIGIAYLAKIIGGKIAPNSDNLELQYFKEPPENIIPYHKKIFEDASKFRVEGTPGIL